MKAISINNISYKANGKNILQDISLSVEENECFVLIGQNGSGKTTLLELLLKDFRPNSGEIHVFGKKSYGFKNFGVVYDTLPLFPMLKVKEIIHYFSLIHRIDIKKVEENFYDIFEIKKISESCLNQLSAGEKKRVSILLALMHDPEILIMDEPFANLDPTMVDKIMKIIKIKPRTILMTTHNWKDAGKIADKIGFLFQGRMVIESQTPENLLKTLPSLKLIVNKTPGLEESLLGINYYLHDNSLNIFLEEKERIMSVVNKFSSNFSIQNVDLKDAYLFNLKLKEVC